MTVPVPLTADPTRWRHTEECPWLWTAVCTCGLSALREAVASGDPLAVLDVLGLGGTLGARLCWACDGDKHERVLGQDNAEVVIDCSVCNGTGSLYRVVRPLPDTPEVSP